MAGKITPELQQAQAATLQAAQAVTAQLTPEQFSRMTDGTVSIYDVFVAQKLITNLKSDGTPNPEDPATKLWLAVDMQFDEQGPLKSLLEGIGDDLSRAAVDVSQLLDQAGTGISQQWNRLFDK